ncbi:hypothetical protein ElyMa_000670900 [Elysia marginata]|uniref:Peptidase S1 domain-containing protein n=1 Tax=Elysia marginata TaxID=1093978 RepID=A0AAV4GHH6_9GAST|nr:hypothetical protein ElyMa_000670900 [Elysia marginata]
MKSAWGVEVTRSKPDRDWCWMDCVTCDEDLGERIEKFNRRVSNKYKLTYKDLSQLSLLSSGDEDCDLALIVSHPHGQPKKITVGTVTHQDIENRRVDYNTPTCPGSSGAPVFGYARWVWLLPVHSGSVGKTSTENNHKLNDFQRWSRKLKGHKTEQEQINFGYEWY